MTGPYVERDGVIRQEPVVDPTLVAEPAIVQPVVAQPVVGAPAVVQPGVVQPAVVQPAVAQPVVAGPAVAAPVAAAPVQAVPVVETVHPATQAVVRRRFWQFDPAALITTIAGVILLLIGLIAITRGGLEGPLTEPAVEVLGFLHTPLLGIIEAVAGALLLLAGITKSREGAMFLSTIIAIGAFVGAIQAESFQRQLAIEERFAWLVVAGSLIVLASNLFIPAVTSRQTVYRTQ